MEDNTLATRSGADSKTYSNDYTGSVLVILNNVILVEDFGRLRTLMGSTRCSVGVVKWKDFAEDI
jgi:hypothetical protein